MDKKWRVLVINPGSTSTKTAIYENEEVMFSESISHPAEKLREFEKIIDQFEFRKELVLKAVSESRIEMESLDAVVGRGGNMKPVDGGTYAVNEPMVRDLKIGVMGQHPSNLGGLIAYDIAKKLNISAFVVDPVVVDEFEDCARISGIPEIVRKSKDHPLNSRAVARKAAEDLEEEYEDSNYITAHLGGGFSVSVHKKGRIIDVNNCLDGDGPFALERAGGLPAGSLVEMCFSGKYTKEEIEMKLRGRGGMTAYLGTNDLREVKRRIAEGDEYAKSIYHAMVYQTSKEIGALATTVNGEVDAIVLTGGAANDEVLVKMIEERTGFIAPIKVYPGEFEMIAMTLGVIRVLEGKNEIKIYK